MNDITFVNLTDQQITLETLEGQVITLPALDIRYKLPKISNETIKTDTIGGLPYDVRFKRPDIKFLPPPKENTIYLVSGMISEVAERDDVLTASEIQAIKKFGKIIAYRRLVRYTRNARSKHSLIQQAER